MRNLTSQQIVDEMKVGWNLGNALDAKGGETAWGNPETTREMITAVKNKGFKTVRIPVTWDEHMGDAPDYIIDAAWLDRVEEVVNYVLEHKLYAIINSHHDDDWLIPTYDHQDKSIAQLTHLWQQVATRFNKYDDHLIFEVINEPRIRGSDLEWKGGAQENHEVINAFNLAAVNTIRNTGGNNTTRHLMIPPYAASAVAPAIDNLKIPNNDARIIVSLHAYHPYFFAMADEGTASWGDESDRASLAAQMDIIYTSFVKNGIPVVLGEWGSINKNNTSERVTHAESYTRAARARHITCIWWDNGKGKATTFRESWALLNRRSLDWDFPEVLEAVIRGAST